MHVAFVREVVHAVGYLPTEPQEQVGKISGFGLSPTLDKSRAQQ